MFGSIGQSVCHHRERTFGCGGSGRLFCSIQPDNARGVWVSSCGKVVGAGGWSHARHNGLAFLSAGCSNQTLLPILPAVSPGDCYFVRFGLPCESLSTLISPNA